MSALPEIPIGPERAHTHSVYDMVGGDETFRVLVDSFYAKIEEDPILRPMFPDDLEEGKRWQRLFLIQFFGGPRYYMEERGHPRLRMRHFRFPIDRRARDQWLGHMLEAIDDAGIVDPARAQMRQYFDRASAFLINRPDEAQASE